MTAAAEEFRHDVMFYGSDVEFVAAAGPFLRGALDEGHGAVVANTPANIELVRDELGGDARHVRFVDCAGVYTRPTHAAAYWRRVLDDFTACGVGYIRVMGEAAFGLPERHPAWIRYESATNHAFAAAPAWLVCAYDTRLLPAALLGDALRTHRSVWDGQRRPTNRYVDPKALLREIAEPVPAVPAEPALVMPVTGDVAGLRAAVRRIAERFGALSAARVEDLTLAVSELATNCLRHASGRGQLALWCVDGQIVCDITDDSGAPIDPVAGYVPPPPGAESGMGLWLTRHVCDAVVITSGERGNSIRFTIGDALR